MRDMARRSLLIGTLVVQAALTFSRRIRSIAVGGKSGSRVRTASYERLLHLPMRASAEHRRGPNLTSRRSTTSRNPDTITFLVSRRHPPSMLMVGDGSESPPLPTRLSLVIASSFLALLLAVTFGRRMHVDYQPAAGGIKWPKARDCGGRQLCTASRASRLLQRGALKFDDYGKRHRPDSFHCHRRAVTEPRIIAFIIGGVFEDRERDVVWGAAVEVRCLSPRRGSSNS